MATWLHKSKGLKIVVEPTVFAAVKGECSFLESWNEEDGECSHHWRLLEKDGISDRFAGGKDS